MSFISTKPIPVRERLIMALDVPSIPEAQALVEELGDSVIFYKVGMELFLILGLVLVVVAHVGAPAPR